MSKRKDGKPKSRRVTARDLAPVYPWERQPGESRKAYKAFTTYLELGEERSVRKSRELIGKSWSLISGWSAKWDWFKRAEAYDRAEDRKRMRAQELARDQMYARQATHAAMAQAAAMRTIAKHVKTEDNPEPEDMADRDAIRLFDVASKVEWRARGEPDVKTEDGGKSAIDASADDRRAALVTLLENPEAVELFEKLSSFMGTDGLDGEG
jgi:hypothetical protein